MKIMSVVLSCWFVFCLVAMGKAIKIETNNYHNTTATVKVANNSLLLQCDNGETWELPYMPIYTEGDEVQVTYNGQHIIGLSPINKQERK